MSTPPPPDPVVVRAPGARRAGRHRADDRAGERWEAGDELLALGDRYLLEQSTAALSIGTDTRVQRSVAVLSLGRLPATLPAAQVLRQVHDAPVVSGPGIAELLDGVLQEDRLLLVFAPAHTTLAQALREHGPLEEEEAAEVILSVADAAAALRQAGLSWAPLDLEHLAVDEEGTVRVLPLPAPLDPGAPAGRHGRGAGPDDVASLHRLARQLLGEPTAPPTSGALHPLLAGSELPDLDELRALLRRRLAGADPAEADAPDEPPSGSGSGSAGRGAQRRGGPAAAHGWVMTVLVALIAAGAVLLVGLIVTA